MGTHPALLEGCGPLPFHRLQPAWLTVIGGSTGALLAAPAKPAGPQGPCGPAGRGAIGAAVVRPAGLAVVRIGSEGEEVPQEMPVRSTRSLR